MFSSMKASEGERQAIITQYEFPPRDYFSREVSLESLYGTCSLEGRFSDRPVITFRRTNSDLFISIDSLAVMPVVPV